MHSRGFDRKNCDAFIRIEQTDSFSEDNWAQVSELEGFEDAPRILFILSWKDKDRLKQSFSLKYTRAGGQQKVCQFTKVGDVNFFCKAEVKITMFTVEVSLVADKNAAEAWYVDSRYHFPGRSSSPSPRAARL